jgi:hypothetical protein
MKVKWTQVSKEDYFQNIEYLEIYWSEKEVLNFITEVDFIIDLLSKNNITFVKSEFESVLKVVVLKQITLYYSMEQDTIYLMRFWNNHQDLKNLKIK